jgi:hypothetical protein
VICVHLLLFTQSDALAGVLRLAPFNLASALLVFAAPGSRARKRPPTLEASP